MNINTIAFKASGKTTNATDLPKSVDHYARVAGKVVYKQTDALNPGLYNIPSKKNPESVNTWEVTSGVPVRTPKAKAPKAVKLTSATLANAILKLSDDKQAKLISLIASL